MAIKEAKDIGGSNLIYTLKFSESFSFYYYNQYRVHAQKWDKITFSFKQL